MNNQEAAALIIQVADVKVSVERFLKQNLALRANLVQSLKLNDPRISPETRNEIVGGIEAILRETA
jgi:hypothetical protein